jgi:predicted DNA-binding protein
MKQKLLPKAEKFTFRLTAEQKAKLEKVAFRNGKRTSEMVRELVLQKIQEAA